MKKNTNQFCIGKSEFWSEDGKIYLRPMEQ